MKAVIFDLGHTLINYYNDWVKPEEKALDMVYQIVCTRCGGVPTKPDFKGALRDQLSDARSRKRREMVEIPLQHLLDSFFDQMGLEKSDGVIEKSMEAFYSTLLEHRELVPGADQILKEVENRGYRVGLISDVAWGLPSKFPMKDMKEYGLDSHFDDLIFSTDVRLRKPNPKIFELSLSRLGVKPENAVYVGNSLQADIKGALDSNMWAVLKKSSYYFPDDEIRPHKEIEEWNEMEEILDELLH